MDCTLGAPALVAASTVARLRVSRPVPGFELCAMYVSAVVALASSTVRLRVSGSVILPLAMALIGCVVCTGASACLVEVPEIRGKANVAAPDKIGMTIVGKFISIDASLPGARYWCFDDPSMTAVVVECDLEYLSVVVTAVVVVEKVDAVDAVESV